ncbi:MAG TPA: glycine cleavage T C-terminal barrel domain-containing protein [Acidimicrobiales bacterium]|nr:glycine cleavage T C-terminal barrel domain-containing protein [Acidimicrobiales bacterium]
MTIEGEAAWACPVPRDVLSATGPDTVSFLQGQLSQDVDALAVGESAFSFLLQPQGKVDAFLRVLRRDDDFVLDTDAGWGEAALARLVRFKLRVRCDLAPLDWRCLAVRGAASAALPGPPDGTWQVVAETPGSAGFDLLGPDPALPDGVEVATPEVYEALRIAAGVPRMGSELEATTIPAATGVIERAVSFTKGCYTGQELVARIDSRGGNVPRRLRGVVAEPGTTPPTGAEVVVGDTVAGTLTSVAHSAVHGAPVALAYLRRDVEPPAGAELRWDGGSARARVEVLPLGG